MDSKNRFLSLIENVQQPVLVDGAMGTMLHSLGVGFGKCFDYLNISSPSLIAEVHQAYIDAGSQIIYTNTFGANAYKLSEHHLATKVGEINRAGVDLAKQAILASFKDVLIAGDVGPLGVRLVPYGRVSSEDAKESFRSQIGHLVEAGVDLLVFETFSDLQEIRVALAAANEVTDIPKVASVTFTRDDRTLLGETPWQVAEILAQSGADIIGANCSGGPAQLLRIIKHMKNASPDARLIIKPNAGWPEQIGGRVMYAAGPDYFGEYAQAFAELDVALVGGCCGTTPDHFAKMRIALDHPAGEKRQINDVLITDPKKRVLDSPDDPTALAQKLDDMKFVVSVEMDPPRGLSTHRLLAGADMLKQAGADVINVADNPMARMRMSPWAVCALIQRRVGIETTLHFPTRGRNLLRVQGDLLAAHALNIRNVFVVMGDPTSIGDYPNAMDNYDLVPSGLIKLVKKGFNLGVDYAGGDIGQPTSFYVGCAVNLLPPDPDREIRLLHRKILNGADFALTQPVYQPENAFKFLELYKRHYGRLNLPLLVGILPLFGGRHASFLHHEVPGIVIPEKIRRRIENKGNRAPQEGVNISIELIEQLKPWTNGIYLMPAFGRYDLAAEIVEAFDGG